MKGVVYKLRCMDETIKEFYVGSSMDIDQRMRGHKSVCNNPNDIGYNIKVYKFIRANQGYGAWTYDILEECDVKDKEDLVLNYERKYILELEPQLNSQIDGRTRREYYEDNKDHIAERMKKYLQENNEKITKYKKEYRIKNKEKIAEYKKEYKLKNKEKISKYQSEKFQCECGGKYTKSNKSIHEKSKKHLAFINNKK